MRLRHTGVGAVILLAACAHAGLRLDTLPQSSSAGAVERYSVDRLTIEGGEIVSFELAEAAEIALVAVTSDGRVSVLYPYAPGESSRFAAGTHALVVPVSMEWTPDPSAQAPSVGATAMEANQAYLRCVAYYSALTGREQAARRAGDTTSRREAFPTSPELTHQVRCQPPATTGTAAGQPGTWRQRNDVVVLVASSTPLTDETLRQRVQTLRVRSEAALRELPARILGDELSPWAGYYSVRLPPPRQQEIPR